MKSKQAFLLAKTLSSGSGSSGVNGASAYEIAVNNGFEGTETEWLESLKGADGTDGQDGADFPYETLTQTEYDALTTKEDKLYIITEEVE